MTFRCITMLLFALLVATIQAFCPPIVFRPAKKFYNTKTHMLEERGDDGPVRWMATHSLGLVLLAGAIPDDLAVEFMREFPAESGTATIAQTRTLAHGGKLDSENLDSDSQAHEKPNEVSKWPSAILPGSDLAALMQKKGPRQAGPLTHGF
ncbi:unnamed protein product [Phaeothamnion confervicola]